VRVLFWGTPEFATAPLRALIGEGFDVVGVVTQPDRAVGRSRSRLVPSPVKEVALEEGIPVQQPDKPRGDAFVAGLRELAPDVSVVVAYGHILPKAVIDAPRLGTLNIHASLLPALRGAAPIQAAIRDGLDELETEAPAESADRMCRLVEPRSAIGDAHPQHPVLDPDLEPDGLVPRQPSMPYGIRDEFGCQQGGSVGVSRVLERHRIANDLTGLGRRSLLDG